jgi:hypothetical protein
MITDCRISSHGSLCRHTSAQENKRLQSRQYDIWSFVPPPRAVSMGSILLEQRRFHSIAGRVLADSNYSLSFEIRRTTRSTTVVLPASARTPRIAFPHGLVAGGVAVGRRQQCKPRVLARPATEDDSRIVTLPISVQNNLNMFKL